LRRAPAVADGRHAQGGTIRAVPPALEPGQAPERIGAAQPYEPPTAELREDLPPRTRHASLGFLSAMACLCAGWVCVLVLYRSQPWSIGWVVAVRSIALFAAGGLAAGVVLRQFRQLKWYWAVLAGPFLAAGAIFMAFSLYYFLQEVLP